MGPEKREIICVCRHNMNEGRNSIKSRLTVLQIKLSTAHTWNCMSNKMTYLCVYIHIYAYTHIHTHMYEYIHIYTTTYICTE